MQFLLYKNVTCTQTKLPDQYVPFISTISGLICEIWDATKTCCLNVRSCDDTTHHNHTYVAVAESTLFISGTDHRVVHSVIMPARLIAGVTVNQRKQCLHQRVRCLTLGC